MEHNKVNFEARSEETREILKNISGAGLKWGIYSLAIIFVIIMVWSTTARFPTIQLVSAKKISNQKIQLVNLEEADKISIDDVEFIIIGKDTLLCNVEMDDNNAINIILEKELPTGLGKELSELKLVSKLNIVQIIFRA